MYLGAPLILFRSPSLGFSYFVKILKPNSWAGEVSAYPVQVGKPLSPSLHYPYLHMLCLLSTSPRRYVTKWMPLPEDFGGNKKRKMANASLGSLGTNFVLQRSRVVLDSKNSKTEIMVCWQSWPRWLPPSETAFACKFSEPNTR